MNVLTRYEDKILAWFPVGEGPISGAYLREVYGDDTILYMYHSSIVKSAIAEKKPVKLTFPPRQATERRDALHPGAEIIYWCLYSDGCQDHVYRKESEDGWLLLDGYSGPKHSPHLHFVPGDKPVAEYGERPE